MTNGELVEAVESLKGVMVAVATGGPRIQDVNDDYVRRRADIRNELGRLGLPDPNPYDDLWAWYGKWSSGDLPTYRSRRLHLADLFNPLLERLVRGPAAQGTKPVGAPTGWARVDRGIGEMRIQLERAENEEQFQAVGLHCREVLISLAQQVYDASKHPTLDGTDAGNADVKRMLEAYLAVELAGGANENARRHARAAFDLTNDLQHRRTANFRQAALCAEATTAVVNIISIVAGRRDP
jgi:hypothetical protein